MGKGQKENSTQVYFEGFVLETERLYIKPLSYDQLLLYTKLDNALEEHLGLCAYSRKLPEELKEALEQVILPQVASAGNQLLFSTLWTIIDKEKKGMVGDLCFKGTPNQHGEVEIGYGTYSDFQGKGFMTEAIGAVCQWAFTHPQVQTILAETGVDNIASHKTLVKNKFSVYKLVGNMKWWRLEKE